VGDRVEEVYVQYRDQFLALLEDRGRRTSASYGTGFSYGKLADAGTAMQKAVEERLVARRIEAARPFRTAEELYLGASAMRLPPAGRQVLVDRKLYDVVLSQPARHGDQLGPFLAAANRTLAWAISTGLMVRPTGLVTVTRTIEQKFMRRQQTLGARGDGRLDLATIVGVTPDNGGAALVHASHPQLQIPGDAPEALVEYHDNLTDFDFDPLRMRLEYLHGVWLEFVEIAGLAIPIVQRAERRFDRPDEGSLTSDELWFATAQPHWCAEVERVFPDSAVVAGECQISSLRGFRYRTTFGDRKLGEPAKFIRDVEKGLPSLLGAYLTCSNPDRERELSGADYLVRLEGRLVAPNGEEFKAVVALSFPHTTSVVYLIPAERATKMNEAAWDAFREALAPLHGVASGRSSDDQGLGITLAREHALDVSSANVDKAANLDVLRSFSHAMEGPGHWTPPDDGSEGQDNDEEEAA
jgi:hypothetical protein